MQPGKIVTGDMRVESILSNFQLFVESAEEWEAHSTLLGNTLLDS